jgi:hypothetical protein
MEKQLINFETAKLAKEKGFDIDASHFYVKHHKCKVFGIDDYGRYYPSTNTPKKLYNIGQDAVLNIENVYFAPTQSLLQRWLRDKYQIDVNPICTYKENGFRLYHLGVIFINDDNKIDTIILKEEESPYNSNKIFKSYEQALEKGLQIALKLITNEK